MSNESITKNIFWKFLPFFIFLTLFKFGAGLHYTLVAPLGERLLPLWLVGTLVGTCSIIQLLLDVPAGRILDRYGYKKFLTVTTLLFLVATVSFTFGLSRATYLISLFFSIFGWLFFGPGMNAYILSSAPKEKAGRFISYRDIFCSTGVVLSSAVLPLTLLLRPQGIGYFLTAILLVALVVLFFSPQDTVPVQVEEKLPTQHHYIRRHPLRTIIKSIKKLNPASGMLMVLYMTGALFYGTIWFVVPLVIAHTVHNGILSLGLGIFDFAVVVLGITLGKLADRTDRRALVFFGLLLFSLAGMFIGFHLTWIFLLFGFLATTGDEMASIALWSWMHSLDKDHARDGTISGVINLFEDFGWAVGPILAGILYDIIGPSWTILIGALPLFIGWVVYHFMVKEYRPHLLSIFSIPQKPHRRRYKQ